MFLRAVVGCDKCFKNIIFFFSSDLVCCIQSKLTKHELLFQNKINLNLKSTLTSTFGGAYLMITQKGFDSNLFPINQ